MDILKPRCPICDWPLKATMIEGCVEGNCSYRPDQGSPEWYRIQRRRSAVCGNCGDPISVEKGGNSPFCGMCREMGCGADIQIAGAK